MNNNSVVKTLDYNDMLYKLYMYLAKLEKSGKKNTSEYDDMIKLVNKISLQAEELMINNDLLNEINDKYEYLKDINDEGHEDYIENLFEGKNLIEKRIFSHLSFLSRELLNITSYDASDYIHLNIFDDEYDLGGGLAVLREIGGDEIVNSIENTIEENKLKYEQYINQEKFYLYSFSVEIYTYLKYLLSDIDREINTEIKNKLIDFKYKFIYYYRPLEKIFIANQNDIMNVDVFYHLLDYFFDINDDVYYYSYIKSYTNYIINDINNVIKRNKINYDNINDLIIDKLESLKIKSLLSIIPDKTTRDEIIKRGIIVLKEIDSEVDRAYILNALLINKDIALPRVKVKK